MTYIHDIVCRLKVSLVKFSYKSNLLLSFAILILQNILKIARFCKLVNLMYYKIVTKKRF